MLNLSKRFFSVWNILCIVSLRKLWNITRTRWFWPLIFCAAFPCPILVTQFSGADVTTPISSCAKKFRRRCFGDSTTLRWGFFLLQDVSTPIFCRVLNFILLIERNRLYYTKVKKHFDLFIGHKVNKPLSKQVSVCHKLPNLYSKLESFFGMYVNFVLSRRGMRRNRTTIHSMKTLFGRWN